MKAAEEIQFARGLSTEKWHKTPRKRGVGHAGARIYTLTDLDGLSRLGMSVVGSFFRKPCPAAWVMSMQARVVCRLLDRGLYVWVMPPKKEEGRRA